MSRGWLLILRVVVLGWLSITALTVALTASVSVEQRLYRTRAERLYDDILSIPLRKATFSDAQRALAPWERYSKASEPCGAPQCDITVDLGFPFPLWAGSPLYAPRKLQWIYWMLDRREPHASARVIIRNGIVWQIQYSAAVWSHRIWLDGGFPDYYLQALVDTEMSRNPWQIVSRYSKKLNEYEVDDFGPTKGGYSARAVFTPYVTADELHRIGKINFACLSGGAPCYQLSDILPAASDVDIHIRRRWYRAPVPVRCGAPEIRMMSRDLNGLGVVEVLAVRGLDAREAASEPSGRIVTARMVEAIKPNRVWNVGEVREFEIEFSEPIPPWSHPAELQPGMRALVLYEPGEARFAADGILAPNCGVLDVNEATLDAAREGAGADERIQPFSEYEVVWWRAERPALKPPAPPEEFEDQLRARGWY